MAPGGPTGGTYVHPEGEHGLGTPTPGAIGLGRRARRTTDARARKRSNVLCGHMGGVMAWRIGRAGA